MKTNIPCDSDQDAIVYIEVGTALKLADLLFPAANEILTPLLPQFAPIVFPPDGPETILHPTNQASSRGTEMGKGKVERYDCAAHLLHFSPDFAYFTLRGASVSAIESLFGTSTCEGINESELRSWEKNQLLLDTTDCVTMQLRRAQPELDLQDICGTSS